MLVKGTPSPALGSCPCARAPRAPQPPLRPESRGLSARISRSASKAVRSPLNQRSSAGSGREPARPSWCPWLSEFPKSPGRHEGQRAPAGTGGTGGATLSQEQLPVTGEMEGGKGQIPELPPSLGAENSSWKFLKRHRRDGEQPGRAAASTGGLCPGRGDGPGDRGQHQEMLQCPGLRAEQIRVNRRFWRGLAMPAALPEFRNSAPKQLPPQPCHMLR